MGTGGGVTPTKAAKSPSTPQEQPAVPYPDWAAAFQAYYGPGVTPPPPPYFASTVASGPTPHPYAWGGQPLMPPYGTPPYAALYPHGGIYAHPSMPPVAHSFGQYSVPSAGNMADVTMAAAPPGTETEAKSLRGKDGNSVKRVKGNVGNLGIVTVARGGGKAISGSANGAFSHSGESGSEGSSEGSEEDNSQNGSEMARKGGFELLTINAGASGHNANIPAHSVQAGEGNITPGRNAMGTAPPIAVTGKPALSVSTTNLNVGMDLWNASTPGSVTSVKGRRGPACIASPILPTTAQLMPCRDGMPSELWVQFEFTQLPCCVCFWKQLILSLVHDERELKRQRRKQSNRESARRSRLRKQAECEELTTKVDALTVENMALKTELSRVAEELKRVTSENTSLLEKLRSLRGEDAVTNLSKNCSSKVQSQFIQPGSGEHFHVISKGSNSNPGQRNEQRESEMCEPAGKSHTLLEANSCSDTVAAG